MRGQSRGRSGLGTVSGQGPCEQNLPPSPPSATLASPDPRSCRHHWPSCAQRCLTGGHKWQRGGTQCQCCPFWKHPDGWHAGAPGRDDLQRWGRAENHACSQRESPPGGRGAAAAGHSARGRWAEMASLLPPARPCLQGQAGGGAGWGRQQGWALRVPSGQEKGGEGTRRTENERHSVSFKGG